MIFLPFKLNSVPAIQSKLICKKGSGFTGGHVIGKSQSITKVEKLANSFWNQ